MVEASLVSFAELGILAIGVAVALQQLRDIKKTREIELETRQAQLFMPIYNRFSDRDFMEDYRTAMMKVEWESFDDFLERYNIKNNPEIRSLIGSMFAYFEGIGVLIERGLIDIDFVANLMSGNVIQFREKFSSIIKGQREATNHPRIFDKTEYLYNEMKKLRGDDWEYKRGMAILERAKLKPEN